MKTIKKVLILSLVLLPMLASAQLIACRDSIKDGYDFWLYLPDDYNPKVQEKPLVMFLHGKSLSGKNLAKVRRYGCLDALAKGRKIDAVIVAPQAQGVWQPEKVLELYDWVRTRYAVDTNRFYVLGMSMGGYGTLDFVATYPDKVAAAMSLCGGSNKSALCDLSEVPLWIIHGTADTAISVKASERVVDAMCACGDTSRLLFHKLPKVNHSKLARIFYLDQTYDWLFSHSLTDSARVANKDYTMSVSIMNSAYDNIQKTTLNVIDSQPGRIEKEEEPVYHNIKPGDSLGKIALKYKTSVAKLCRLNNMRKEDVLSVGKKIRVK